MPYQPRVSDVPHPDFSRLTDARLAEATGEISGDFARQWSLLAAAAGEELGRATEAAMPECVKVWIYHSVEYGDSSYGLEAYGDVPDDSDDPLEDGIYDVAPELADLYLGYARRLGIVGEWFDVKGRCFR